MRQAAMKSLPALAFIFLFAFQAMAAEINLFAAASLREVVTALSDSFAGKNGDVTFRRNFGASGAVAKQIENGAPADIFFSANVEWMDYLRERKLIDGKTISTLAYNVLVFAGEPGLKARRMQDLVKLNRIAIGSPKSVPCGQYAMEAIRRAGIEKQLENKLVMARDVRQCLLYVERGEVDGSFVYKTDVEEAAVSAKVLFVVPQGLYPRVTYPIGLTAAGGKKAEAAAFLRYLRSAEAKKILSEHGFAIR